MTAIDSWEEGSSYERFMGRWSRPLANHFIEWLQAAPRRCWLDVGCGTGVLSQRLAVLSAPTQVVGIDFSPGFIAYARAHVAQQSKIVIDFREGDAGALPIGSYSFDYAVSALALNFFPDALRAVTEMTRVVHSGGTVALYVWDYANKMQLLRLFWDAAITLDTAAAALDEGVRFPICAPAQLQNLFAAAGLDEITTAPLDTVAHFVDFQDYWLPFLGRSGPAPSYVATLAVEQQAALAATIKHSLPIASDGTITLPLRAWAVRGRKR
jgi:ubiquinone/menaquinone biosynthesis C-methylase UbiE